MVDKKISDLPLAAVAVRAMEVEVNDAGTSRRLTLENIVRSVIGASNGFLVRTTAGVATPRSITATAPLTVTDGDGVAANPLIAATLATAPQAVAGTGIGLMNAPLVKLAIDARLGSGGGWSAYDGATGVFYDYAVNGAQAFVDTPDFGDGYEYRILFTGVKGSRAATYKYVNVASYMQEAAAFTTSVSLFAAADALTQADAEFDADMHIAVPRLLRKSHGWHAEGVSVYKGAGGFVGPSGANAWSPGTYGRQQYRKSTEYRVLRMRLAWSTGNFGGGTMRLIRQPVAV